MTPRLIPQPASEVAQRLKDGRAVLIDIREPDEFARAHAPGAISRPLSTFEAAHLKIEASQDAVFTCKTGMRTGANCDRLAASISGEAYVLEGGLDAWTKAGLPVAENTRAPIEMNRQVMITAGLLVLTGVILGVTVNPGFYGLSAFVGAGLTFAGVTGFCGMARILALAPWNRVQA
ncbi:rhodanese family protein [Phenylobacterium aquaticum]|uniref:rhodanese family protein n=1 Tax=Phenylobacterium aquaticum TaxID=1763816 RepID=UPI0026F1F138|nr:rhodanese family protein [Phenylobacterium aquaticum]